MRSLFLLTQQRKFLFHFFVPNSYGYEGALYPIMFTYLLCAKLTLWFYQKI